MSITPSLYAKARAEIIALFGWDAGSLSPDQTLRVDCAVALRLALDDLQGRIVRGESADVARMLTASEALARLLPPAVLATPPSESREDPRQVMWEIYRTMRERGELGLRALEPADTDNVTITDDGRHRIAELEAEVERLTQLAGRNRSNGGRNRPAIDPPLSDIVPASERAERDVGPRAGPDDPKPRRPGPVIEGKVAPPSRPPDWDDTPSGRAWQAWHDAGGSVGGDRWANNNR